MKGDKMTLIPAGLLIFEVLAGVVWSIQRGLSSLFARRPSGWPEREGGSAMGGRG
jgi:hypothetical protein